MAAAPARAAWLAVLVAALGYFVDIYDLILFSVVRTPSLKALGVPVDELLPVGLDVLGWQTFGMLVGGLIWGVLADRRGRLSVLFGSILLYSLANIANGFVTSVDEYKLLRFIAGVGLAGELGAGITLVSELVDKRLRGYATTIVAGVGICGALVAVTVAKNTSWQNAYFVGGGMGLALLVLRISVAESGLFNAVKAQAHVTRGNFFALFSDRRRLTRYLAIIAVGVPIWFVVAILASGAPEIGKAMGMAVPPTAPDAIFWLYAGLAVGDFASGALSQVLKSRKQALLVFLAITALGMLHYFTLGRQSPTLFYVGCGILGLGTGYWAVFVTVAAEQFGTNLRGVAATTVPNFVRGSVDVSKWAFLALAPGLGLVKSALVVGCIELAIAVVALFFLEETYGKDLDYVEGT